MDISSTTIRFLSHAVLILLCLLSSAAMADEYWVCNFPDTGNGVFPEHFLLRNQHFLEIVPRVDYDVMVDNQLAIVAVEAAGSGYSRRVPPSIYTDTIAINRKTGDAVKGFVGLYDTKRTPPVHGKCDQETSRDQKQQP